MKVEEKPKLVESALVKLKHEYWYEGVNFTLEEREVVIGALDVAHEIVSQIVAAKRLAT